MQSKKRKDVMDATQRCSERETPEDAGNCQTLQPTHRLVVVVVVVVIGAVTLFTGLTLFCTLSVTRPAAPEVLHTCEASSTKLQECEKQRQGLHLMLLSVTQDLRCSLCPDGWRWWSHHCYFFSTGLQENLRWSESAEFCLKHNSSLAVIKDSAEMDFIQGVMRSVSRFPFLWVGLSDSEQEGQWLWWDGADLQHYMPVTVEWDADHRDCADLRGGGSLFAADCEAYGPWVCKRET